MKLTLKEMNGLLNGQYLPSDLIVGETLAEYLVRKFTELEQQLAESHRALRAETTAHENMQMQVEKLAAENAGLKEYRPQPSGAAMMEALDVFYEYHEDVPEQGMMAAFEILCCKRPVIPATYAFLAEVRAQGVDAFLRDSQLPYQIATVLADYDNVDDATLQTVIWSGQPPEPDGDVWHLEYVSRGNAIVRAVLKELRKGVQS
ncbi:hypothetical protein DM877_11040 [Enterobacter cloacae]|uniref:Ead/Ea22-like family protein n=2 Tax=Enterobacter TaxID=547 RepID=A0A4Q2E964_ENTCL|nr:hypothetical protein [Enterobacter cloacae]RXW28936.1 hypothetical protein DM877_11040 [Enterobacter cloacae]